ncbi:MAG: hypothetical protein N0C84_06030 [Candidatus Thiodiazotropha taylori]|uniref:Uncharacterized protein n=1 Tax=Candidatus Thiodiazotropha taylori TaxID=2792791 RepID=A0A9E4KC37_9GAMM|nr:hypothetical protein [Candidatus Thiodiazotropha taylori]MCW4256013.1 hypothetical protein [Candidatus Thiodiazotropha taylori]
MLNINILGYLVLRKPEYNFDELGRGAYLPYAPKIDTIYYGGIDRMEWFDIDEKYYNDTLPNDILKLRDKVIDASRQYNFNVCTCLDDAKKMLAFSNKDQDRNDLIAISLYNKIENTIDAEFEGELLGCDLYCDGFGSLIREGIFNKPELFREYATNLNKNGLFDINKNIIQKYTEMYEIVSVSNNLEQFDGPIKSVSVYKLF